MKEHDTGRLRAFLDGELAPEERQAVAAHVDRCAECAAELKLLEQRAAAAAGLLNELELRGEAPNPQAALVRFERARTQDSGAAGPAAWWGNVTRSFEMIKRSAVSPRWRPALVALSAVVVVALLFSIAPVRLAAADFLSLFRVRKFAVIPLDTAAARQARTAGEAGRRPVRRPADRAGERAGAGGDRCRAGVVTGRLQRPDAVPAAVGFVTLEVHRPVRAGDAL